MVTPQFTNDYMFSLQAGHIIYLYTLQVAIYKYTNVYTNTQMVKQIYTSCSETGTSPNVSDQMVTSDGITCNAVTVTALHVTLLQ